MKYLFILGRNPELSTMEIFSFLERQNIKLLKSELQKNSLIIHTKNSLPANAIDYLGGTLAIGIVFTDDLNKLDEKEIYIGTKNKLNYVVWDFSNKTQKLKNYLKKRFKEEKLKATEKQFGSFIILQNEKSVPNISSKTIDEQFFVFKDYFGKIIQTCDYDQLEKRDMEKPVRRGELAISPKLSKIMINLSLIKEKGTLLDPFCGIGVILQEALLQDLKVVGIDIDKKAIKGANENLAWGNFSNTKYQLIHKDSKKAKINKVNVLVAEPDLGETLKIIEDGKNKIIIRRTYSYRKAKERMKKFEDLIIDVLNNLKENILERIVFTAPFIKCFDKKDGRVGCEIEYILNKTRLKLIKGFPINDFRQDQITGRQIFVLER